MSTINQQPLQIERCPYLGLHDDASTSLAYPSPWNYCYHAEPPASIQIAQQVNICLNMNYLQCPLIVACKWGRLPRNLRGKAGRHTLKNELSGKLLWLAILLLVILILIFFLGRALLFS